MKKALILSLIMAIGLTMSAFAGPLIGVSTVPYSSPVAANLAIGWDFSIAHLEVTTGNFSFLKGNIAATALWTPSVGTFGYRAGITAKFDWVNSGKIYYKGLIFVLGVSDTWGPMQIFGELDIKPYGTLRVLPRIGVNVLFDGLIPRVQQ